MSFKIARYFFGYRMYLSKKCGNAVFMSFWGRQPICSYLTKFFDPLSVLFLNFLLFTDVPQKGASRFLKYVYCYVFFVGSVCKDALCVCANIYYYYRYIYYPGYDHVTALPLSRLPPLPYLPPSPRHHPAQSRLFCQ